jgi:beta-phosphoglucomutase
MNLGKHHSSSSQRQSVSGIKAIIFDAEGVIVDTEKMWDAAQDEFMRRRGISYDRAKIKHLLSGKSQPDAIEILKAECGLTGDAQLLADERRELVRRHLANGVNFVTGFPEFFQRVQPDYRTAVGTAMPEELLAIVDARLSLSRLFDGRIYSLSAVGYRSKPNPDIFLYAAGRLGVEPANCLVIEDAPHGVEAARRAGMKCVALTTTFDRQTLSNADVVADSFAQIELAGL